MFTWSLALEPLFVVPNHMLGQFSAELLTLYPGANILLATKDDFNKEKRKTLMSRIATGNWDAVIVTHSGFEKLPLSRETQKAFFDEQLQELSVAIEEQRRGESNSRMVKILERAKKRLEGTMKGLLGAERKDDTLTFEELGVDRLFVDEAHYFKNLFYVSKMTRIAGLPQTASQRAFDMFLKVSHVQRINGGGGVVFAGFQLLVADNLMRGPEILLRGASFHVAKVTDTALGTIRSVEHTIQSLDEAAAGVKKAIQRRTSAPTI